MQIVAAEPHLDAAFAVIQRDADEARDELNDWWFLPIQRNKVYRKAHAIDAIRLGYCWE